MKSLLILALVAVACQAFPKEIDEPTPVVNHSNVVPVPLLKMDPVESAPKYPGARIINGIQASRGQFPHQAALYLDGGSFCGGSLISPRWVLTAAHCAVRVSSFTVYLGAQDIGRAAEAGRLVVTTRSKVVHSGYLPPLAPNDVALLDLGQDVPLSDLVQPVSLATGGDLYEGVVARVSGWGKASDASNSVNPQLQFVDLSIISNAVCRQTFGLLNVRASTICAQGAGGRSTCQGDSGGPLLDVRSGKQIGVVSYGHKDGCESGHPNGFARVTSFIDWISQNTGLAF